MILGSKAFSELSEQELLDGIEEIRKSREALRADAMRKRTPGAIPVDAPAAREAREKIQKARAPRVKSASQAMLEWLMTTEDK